MKIIVWDLDDVLNNLMESWLINAWGCEHPDTCPAYSELKSNPPLGELKATRAAYEESLDRFRLSPAGQNLAPNPLLLSWFHREGSRFEHHVLTARPAKTIAVAAAWVFTHFGHWVRHFHFVPSRRPGDWAPEYDANKSELLARLGRVDLFVDDSPVNVAGVAALGKETYLFPQPWNRTGKTVEQFLNELSTDAGE